MFTKALLVTLAISKEKKEKGREGEESRGERRRGKSRAEQSRAWQGRAEYSREQKRIKKTEENRREGKEM